MRDILPNGIMWLLRPVSVHVIDSRGFRRRGGGCGGGDVRGVVLSLVGPSGKMRFYDGAQVRIRLITRIVASGHLAYFRLEQCALLRLYRLFFVHSLVTLSVPKDDSRRRDYWAGGSHHPPGQKT